MSEAITRFLNAIGYPERMPKDSLPFKLRVDGAEVSVEEAGGRIVLSYALADDDSFLPKLAVYAAGRMLKESATLAYGNHLAFLWQDESADADAHGFLRFFETFMDSCDWWRARVDALRENEESAPPETMLIRP